MVKIGFIGTGHMGLAIILSVSNTKLPVRFMAYDPEEKSYPFLLQKGVVTCESALEVAKRCDYIILSVNAESYPQILESFRSDVSQIGVIISLAPGVREEDIVRMLGAEAKIILAMPNYPIIVRQGSTILAAGDQATDYDLDFVRSIFSMSGDVMVVKKEQLDAFYPIVGSSPAFVLAFAKGFLEYAAAHNMDLDDAKKLFSHVLKGSATMMLESDIPLDRWIASIAALGTPAQVGIDYIQKRSFEQIVREGCESCYQAETSGRVQKET